MSAGPVTRLLSWVSMLDEPERMSFYADLKSAVDTACEEDDPGAIERCVRQWRLTAEGMENASLRDSLLES